MSGTRAHADDGPATFFYFLFFCWAFITVQWLIPLIYINDVIAEKCWQHIFLVVVGLYIELVKRNAVKMG